MILKDGELIAGDTIRLIDNTYGGKPLEPDGEGVAYADEFYYVIGSHGNPRARAHKLRPKKDAARIRARILASSQIVRISAGQTDGARVIQRTVKLGDVIAAEPALSPFAGKRLENNGLTIEGVAVSGGRLFAGFRGPVLENDRAAVLSVSLDSLFGNQRSDPFLFRLPLGQGQGVRDLASFDEGIPILAGPSADGPGPYAVHWWDANSDRVRLLTDLAEVTGKKGKRKAEALLPLERSPSGLRVLILFDGEQEGAPSPVTMSAP